MSRGASKEHGTISAVAGRGAGSECRIRVQDHRAEPYRKGERSWTWSLTLGGRRQPVQGVADHGDEILGVVPQQRVRHNKSRDSPARGDVPTPPVFLEAGPVHVESRPVGLDAETAVDHQVQVSHPWNVDLRFNMETGPPQQEPGQALNERL